MSTTSTNGSSHSISNATAMGPRLFGKSSAAMSKVGDAPFHLVHQTTACYMNNLHICWHGCAGACASFWHIHIRALAYTTTPFFWYKHRYATTAHERDVNQIWHLFLFVRNKWPHRLQGTLVSLPLPSWCAPVGPRNWKQPAALRNNIYLRIFRPTVWYGDCQKYRSILFHSLTCPVKNASDLFSWARVQK